MQTGEEDAEASPETFLLAQIGTFRSCFPAAFGCPRQGLAAPTSRGQIKLADWLTTSGGGGQYLEGLEAFSHVWVIFLFDQNKHSKTSFDPACSFLKPTVRPPWLAGDDGRRAKRGVFATRSPHRPNPVGLTLCRLDWIDQVNSTIYISGVDVVNGSAVLDIKPYHPVESFGRDLQSSAKVETEEIHFADWLPKPQPCIDISWSDAALTELHELQEHCRFYPDDRDRRSNLEFPSSTSSELIRLAIDEALGRRLSLDQDSNDTKPRYNEKH
eukprot:s7281_g2.t1